jgi:hypothetical protein
MSELKHRRAFHPAARVAAQVRTRARAQAPIRPQHSVWDDESRIDRAASRRAVSLRWRNFANRLRITDAAAITVAVASAYELRFGAEATTAAGEGFEARYLVVSTLLLVAWFGFLEIYPTRDCRTFGVGAAEYKRVAQATLKLFGALAIAMVFVRFDVVRGYFAVALPLGLLLLTGSRWLWRRWLNRKRAEGQYLSRVIVIGDRSDVEYVINQIEKNPTAGYEISGVGLPNLEKSTELRGGRGRGRGHRRGASPRWEQIHPGTGMEAGGDRDGTRPGFHPYQRCRPPNPLASG